MAADILGAFGGVGVGLEAAGAITSVIGASQAASIEKQENVVRRNMMETLARRKSLEALRNQQQARSMSLAAGVAQGGGGYAGGGSSAKGGAYGQIGGETGTNLLDLRQNVMAGEQMFNLQNKMVNAQFLTGLGSGLSGAGGAMTSQGTLNAVSNLTGIPS
jgi:hypothetical protein